MSRKIKTSTQIAYIMQGKMFCETVECRIQGEQMMEEEDEFSLKYTVFGVPVLLKEWICNHKVGICAGGKNLGIMW